MSRVATLVFSLAIFVFATTAQGLVINLIDVGVTPMTQVQLNAFERAAAQWEDRLDDPITVTLNVALSPLATNILGSTRTMVTTHSLRGVVTCLVAVAEDTPERIIMQLLDANSIDVADVNGIRAEDRVTLSRANARAIMLSDNIDPLYGPALANDADGRIEFNSNLLSTFDFDRTNGIGASALDFEAVAAHEIGHALGFFSVTDNQDFNPAFVLHPNTLDLWRFIDTNLNHGINSESRRINSGPAEYDDTDLQFLDFSRGMMNVDPVCQTGTQQCQSSHWRDQGPQLMDPTLSQGVILDVHADDLHAFDFMGFDRNPNFKRKKLLGAIGVIVENPALPQYVALAMFPPIGPFGAPNFTPTDGYAVTIDLDALGIGSRTATGLVRFQATQAFAGGPLVGPVPSAGEQDLFPPQPAVTSVPAKLTDFFMVSPGGENQVSINFFDSFGDAGAELDMSIGSFGGYQFAAMMDGDGDGVAADLDGLIVFTLEATLPDLSEFALSATADDEILILDSEALGVAALVPTGLLTPWVVAAIMILVAGGFLKRNKQTLRSL